MDKLKPLRHKDLKHQADFLLKDLKNTSRAAETARRFSQIKPFINTTPDTLLRAVKTVRLKHAYAVLAFERGYSHWWELKEAVIENDCLYRYCCTAFVHQWFTHYDEAKKYFEKNDGYLLSFWNDYAVCGAEYITCLGLGEHQRLWSRIGYNWVTPADTEAYTKLKSLARENYLSLL